MEGLFIPTRPEENLDHMDQWHLACDKMVEEIRNHNQPKKPALAIAFEDYK